jgi:hypothetical protein
MMDTNTIEVEDLTTQWVIPAYRVEEFQRIVERANRKLEGKAEFLFKYEEPHMVEQHDKESGTTVLVPFVTVTLASPFRLAIGNFTFIASLIPEEAGVTVHTAPGQSLDGWKRPALEDFNRCDHCGLKRNRSRVYIVRNDDTGDLVRLGHNCIAKYTGFSPNGLWALEFDRELDRLAEEPSEGFGGWSSRDYGATLAAVLGMAFAFSNEGKRYVSKAASEAGVGAATSGEVRAALFFPPRPPQRSRDVRAMEEYRKWMKLRDKGFQYAKDEALIADILAAAETLTPGTDYADNMHTIVAGENVSGRNVGILASLVAVYARNKELAEERKLEPAAKGFLGEVGDKLRDVTLKVKTVRQWENDFGVTTMIVGRTEDQHTVVWRASREIDIEPGAILNIKSATIKAHDEFKGVDQTVVTRARIA